jgi:phospholipid transport system substrate-binding protein
MRNKSIYIVIFSFFFFFRFFPALATGSPLSDIKGSIDAILIVLKNADQDKQVKNNKITQIVHERFDFEEMSKRVLATNWSSLSRQERDKFIDLFTKLLEASYRNKLDTYKNEYVEYKKELIRGQHAKVDTNIVTQTGTIPINYIMLRKETAWHVYDVVIENVSLVGNYRSSFNDIIKRDGFPSLIDGMKNKIKELESS